jgi:glutaminyl-peptide cyclotransferase
MFKFPRTSLWLLPHPGFPCSAIFSIFIFFLFFSVSAQNKSAPLRSVPFIVRTIPHDTKAFTQGLLWYKGVLYESTGQYGQSSLRSIDPVDGRILKNVPVPDVFAEGLCRMDSFLVQLTWKERAAIKYSLVDFSIKGSFSYSGEGWGLTTNGTSFIMSNGSDTLYFRNRHFSIIKKISVKNAGKPLVSLNELEYVKGLIYSNVWFNTSIYVIQPSSGKVVREIDCTPLVAKNGSPSDQDVLNGIAYNEKTGTFYITGKNWRYIFEVKM